KIWLPYPVSSNEQLIEDINIEGNFINSAVYKEPESGVLYFFAEWNKAEQEKKLEFGFKVSAKERIVRNLTNTGGDIPVEIKKYLQPDWWIPTDGESSRNC
ncbi:[weak similarity to] transglutaminase domain-containing protein, partial [methanotrophic bacterial endosymbiont of Bathymodiolus sp.]